MRARVPYIADKATYIGQCLELAILLEVSSDKPGNVNFVTGFNGTNHLHFLASAVAAGPYFKKAAERGIAISEGRLDLSGIGLGQIIRDCISEISFWQSGGNTLLGTILLLSPIAVAAGMTPMNGGSFNLQSLRQNIRKVVRSTTPEDAVAVYDAIKIAKPGGLGKAPDLDVNDPSSIERIIKEQISLIKVFEIASNYDLICYEWVNDYTVTFDFAYPSLMMEMNMVGDMNKAVIHTFLRVLAKHPDTFIARKAGVQRAKEVSAMAIEVLKLGGLNTQEGKAKLQEMDAMLRRESSLLNPGTTADIIAAALALLILSGYKP
ncbi:MAG: triphosphoribosyl-dephospho-CoA synthase [Candidatus Bathyarchaeia archaeon]|nr:triphosphoribosyl-dephospho-CoA synthase [Candidatus Bathyarchaeota archaeon]